MCCVHNVLDECVHNLQRILCGKQFKQRTVCMQHFDKKLKPTKETFVLKGVPHCPTFLKRARVRGQINPIYSINFAEFDHEISQKISLSMAEIDFAYKGLVVHPLHRTFCPVCRSSFVEPAFAHGAALGLQLGPCLRDSTCGTKGDTGI